MLKIKIFSPGKTQKQWLSDALSEYEKWLSRDISIIWINSYEKLPRERSYICLDLGGKRFTSPEFSKFLYQKFEEGGARLNIVIGGAEGIPEEIIQGATDCVCFSTLTFTHQMIRLILLEQIYRALQIEKGSEYHR